MAESFSAAAANAILDAHIAAYPWIQLHTGAPGAAGTTAVAGNTTRKDTTSSWAAATGGVATSDVVISWTEGEVDTTEDYTHYSLWSASTAGNFGSSGTIIANSVNASGDTFEISTGFTLTMTIAS